MPCFQRRHQHRFVQFHPYMMMDPHNAAAMFFDHTDEAEEELAPFLKGKARISESSGEEGEDNHYYVIQMAVPGVRAHHITIEENKGELEIVAIRLGGNGNEEVVKTYQDVLFLHPSKADLPKLVATIKDGILTVRVPKKLNEVVIIEAQSAPAPPSPQKNQKTSQDENDAAMEQEEVEQEDFRVSWDLPGVSVRDLAVEIHNNRDEDQVQITAERQRPRGTTCHFRRTTTVPPSIDMTQAHAYLQDGVFTLVAPQHQEEDQAVDVRTFYATPEDDAILPEVASLQINEGNDSTPPMLVESVAQEWETIEPETNPAQKAAEHNVMDDSEAQKPVPK
jgi:HSP20 family molecular chaperone IbpA